jgi:hypothetical protein
MKKSELKNGKKYLILNGDSSQMIGKVSILSNGYISFKDPKGFIYSLSELEFRFKDINFQIYTPI